MTQWHLKSKRKKTGGLRKSRKRADKKLSQRGGEFSATNIVSDEKAVKRKKIRKRGGKKKIKLQKVLYASISTPGSNKTTKVKITSVKENIANKEYSRRNIITKNAVIEVEFEGKNASARVTSRPGQAGTVSAILIEEQSKKAA